MLRVQKFPAEIQPTEKREHISDRRTHGRAKLHRQLEARLRTKENLRTFSRAARGREKKNARSQLTRHAGIVGTTSLSITMQHVQLRPIRRRRRRLATEIPVMTT